MPLVHHELCFGCGRTNLFGLLLELEETEPGTAAGRCFIKQDHQGADRGFAHQGVVATALGEAMALLCGPTAEAQAVTVGYVGAVAVGAFLDVEASIEERDNDVITATASAAAEDTLIARARGTYTAR